VAGLSEREGAGWVGRVRLLSWCRGVVVSWCSAVHSAVLAWLCVLADAWLANNLLPPVADWRCNHRANLNFRSSISIRARTGFNYVYRQKSVKKRPCWGGSQTAKRRVIFEFWWRVHLFAFRLPNCTQLCLRGNQPSYEARTPGPPGYLVSHDCPPLFIDWPD
jgi:hypothetical protein